MVVAVALSATSVGVALAAWQDHKLMQSDLAGLLTDVAELDDISAVALMAMLFALLPVLFTGISGMAAAVGGEWLGFLLTFGGFVAVRLLFSYFTERRMTRCSQHLDTALLRMLLVAGVGFLIAAFTEHLGYSLAIGALVAGSLPARTAKRAAARGAHDPAGGDRHGHSVSDTKARHPGCATCGVCWNGVGDAGDQHTDTAAAGATAAALCIVH